MIQIKNNEATSTEGKWVRNKITGAVAKRQGCLPSMSADDFEELDEKPAYTKEQYDEKVAELIRLKYTQDEENAIKSKVLASLLPNTFSEETNEKHMRQFAEFNAHREACKARAREELAKGVNNNEIKD